MIFFLRHDIFPLINGMSGIVFGFTITSSMAVNNTQNRPLLPTPAEQCTTTEFSVVCSSYLVRVSFTKLTIAVGLVGNKLRKQTIMKETQLRSRTCPAKMWTANEVTIWLSSSGEHLLTSSVQPSDLSSSYSPVISLCLWSSSPFRFPSANKLRPLTARQLISHSRDAHYQKSVHDIGNRSSLFIITHVNNLRQGFVF